MALNAKMRLVASFFVVTCLFLPNSQAMFNKGTNGGFKCIGCTVVFAIMDQLSVVHNESMSRAAYRMCTFLPDKRLTELCNVVVSGSATWLDQIHSMGATPDTICQTLNICTSEKGKYCRIFTKNKKNDFFRQQIKIRQYFKNSQNNLANILGNLNEMSPNMGFLCKLPLIKKICFAMKHYFSHMPVYDKDGDLFSQKYPLRGAYWRGKDCDDSDAKIHPGAKTINSDIHTDSNCNGIYGSDPSGRPYEDIFCKNSNPRGFAVIGDSIAAHLHIPEEWLDATKINKESFKNVLLLIENEMDWPQLSFTTGFMNSTWNVVKGSTDSIYYRLWKRNRCIHRDFQNIGINGARSLKATKYVKSLSRNQTTDYPLIVSYSLVGNDVCNWHIDSLKYMTTPKEMFHNAMETLKYLDTILPKGSFVLINGLVDGRILYNTMHERIHPIGRTRNDVTYNDFYEYMNCMELSMCSGWLTSNETLRNLTQQRADQLSNVLENIMKNHNNFKNFRLHYIGKLFHRLVNAWEKKGGSAWQIIEPVDGFHNNQLSEPLVTDIVWKILEKEAPEILGQINPNNEKIKKIFGNQGGY